jgi:hypothetical protein
LARFNFWAANIGVFVPSTVEPSWILDSAVEAESNIDL